MSASGSSISAKRFTPQFILTSTVKTRINKIWIDQAGEKHYSIGAPAGVINKGRPHKVAALLWR